MIFKEESRKFRVLVFFWNYDRSIGCPELARGDAGLPPQEGPEAEGRAAGSAGPATLESPAAFAKTIAAGRFSCRTEGFGGDGGREGSEGRRGGRI